jgi:protease-4
MQWERQVLERLLRSAAEEQRRGRRWSIFFKILTFIYLFSLLFLALGWLVAKIRLLGRHTAMVESQE